MTGPEINVTISGDASGAQAAFESVQAAAKATASAVDEVTRAAAELDVELKLEEDIARNAYGVQQQGAADAANAAEELKEMLGNAYHAASQEVDQFNERLRESEKEGHSAKETFKELFEHLSGFKMPSMGTLFSIGGIVGIVEGVKHLTEATMQYAETVDLLERKTGVEAIELQRLGYAANQNKSSLEGLGAGLKFLQRNMANAVDGNEETAKSFHDLGISLKDAEGNVRPTQEVLLDLADAMQKTPDAAQRTQMAMKLLGRGGIELVPLLSQGSAAIKALGDEAERTGAVISKDAISTTEHYEKAMKALEDSTHAVGAAFIQAFVPALTAVAHGITAIIGLYQQWQDLIGAGGPGTINFKEKLETELRERIEKMSPSRQEEFRAAMQHQFESRSAFKDVSKDVEEFSDRSKHSVESAIAAMQVLIGMYGEKFPSATEEAKKALLKFRHEADTPSQLALIEEVQAGMKRVEDTSAAYDEARKERDKKKHDDFVKDIQDGMKAGEQAVEALNKAEEDADKERKRRAKERMDDMLALVEEVNKKEIAASEERIKIILANDERTAAQRVADIDAQLEHEHANGKALEEIDRERAEKQIALAKEVAGNQNLSLDARIAQLREEESLIKESAEAARVRAEIEKLINGLVFQRFQAQKGEAFARFEDVGANEVRVNELKLAYLQDYIDKASNAESAADRLTYQQKTQLEKELHALKLKLRDAEIKDLLAEEKATEKGQNRDLEKDLRDAKKRVQDRESKNKDATAEQARVDQLEDALFRRHEQSVINRIKNDAKLDADGKREALQQWLQHEQARGDISVRTRKRIDRELAELERQRLAEKFPGMTEAQARKAEEEAQKEAAKAQEKAAKEQKEAQDKAAADAQKAVEMAEVQRTKQITLLQDIIAAIKALKLDVVVNCVPCDGDGSGGGGKGGGGKGDGGKPTTVQTEAAKGLKDALNKAEDAKKSLAENIKSEFAPSKPGNANYALEKTGQSAENLADNLGKVADAAHDAASAVKDVGGVAGAGAASGGGAVGSGGGGGGGGAGAPGGAGAGDGGGKPGDGGKGGAGGGGGKGSVSSGGGGGGAGGAGGGGGQGGKGGDATVSIHLPGFGPGISDAAAAGLANYRTRYLRDTVGLTNEYNEIARSGDPIAMRIFLERHPEFRGTGSGGISYGSGSGALGGVGGAGGGRPGEPGGSTPVNVTNRDPIPTRDVSRDPSKGGWAPSTRVELPKSMMEDLARYRGGFALPSKVEEISRALSGGGKFGETAIDSGGMRAPGSIGHAETVNQDIDVKVDMSGVQINSKYDVKRLAEDLGSQITGAIKSVRQGAI